MQQPPPEGHKIAFKGVCAVGGWNKAAAAGAPQEGFRRPYKGVLRAREYKHPQGEQNALKAILEPFGGKRLFPWSVALLFTNMRYIINTHY